MIHGYHLIWGSYGFWLPNDPRGSWSDFVASWELVRFGHATRPIDSVKVDLEQWAKWRQQARASLKYPAVQFAGEQAQAIGNGFANGVRKSKLTVWACSVLPDHVHMIVARHTYKAEQICNLLKGEATKALAAKSLHPHFGLTTDKGDTPSPWERGHWKVYLDCEEQIEQAIRYVEQNPVKEGKPLQKWSFVSPFFGLPAGWITYK
jgi:REP element-mobilizing transposase RayT